jgi:hypothetical protein
MPNKMAYSVDAEAPSFFDDGTRRWRGCRFNPFCSWALGVAVIVLLVVNSITLVRALELVSSHVPLACGRADTCSLKDTQFGEFPRSYEYGAHRIFTTTKHMKMCTSSWLQHAMMIVMRRYAARKN